MMEDPWNATEEDLRAWAYSPGALYPIEDWDLAVTADSNAELLLEFASDPACPSREFFLRCLYLLVGDAVRSRFIAHARGAVENLLAQVGEKSLPTVIQWAVRSRSLLDAPPSAVDYATWCDGGLVRGEGNGAG